MTFRYMLACAGIACLSLFISGCATAPAGSAMAEAQPAQRKDRWDLFLAGKARLSCGLSCSGTWGYNRRTLKALHTAEQWTVLAERVLEIGYEGDLSYYYLGRAAEGLGHLVAAQQYYGLSVAQSMLPGKCAGLLNNCDGFAFPRDSKVRLDASRVPDKSRAAAAEKPESKPQLTQASSTTSMQASTSDSDQSLDSKPVATGEVSPSSQNQQSPHRDYVLLSEQGLIALIDRLYGQKTAKSEFETSQEAAARIRELTGGYYAITLKGPVALVSRKWVSYNADTEVLTISPYARLMDLYHFTGVLGDFQRRVPKLQVIHKQLPSENYVGQNAYGAKVNVTRLRSEGYSLAFANTAFKSGQLQSALFERHIRMPRDEAKLVIANLVFKFEFQVSLIPAAKSLVALDGIHSEATIRDPTALSFTERVLSVDLHRIIVTDARSDAILASSK